MHVVHVASSFHGLPHPLYHFCTAPRRLKSHAMHGCPCAITCHTFLAAGRHLMQELYPARHDHNSFITRFISELNDGIFRGLSILKCSKRSVNRGSSRCGRSVRGMLTALLYHSPSPGELEESPLLPSTGSCPWWVIGVVVGYSPTFSTPLITSLQGNHTTLSAAYTSDK